MIYMGSKNRLSKKVAPIINDIIKELNIKSYIEPFVGGANMIDKIKCEKRIGYDYNEYLISLLNYVKEGNEYNIELVDKALYFDVKGDKDKYESHIVGLIGFLCSYKGKFFGGYNGIVETKEGIIRDYRKEAYKNLINQSKYLNEVEFKHSDYSKLKDFKGCIIYCDPPYKNTTGYKTKEEFEHYIFYEWVKELSKNNIVLFSEYNAPIDFIEIYTEEINCNLDGSNKKKIEKIFIHKDSKYLEFIKTKFQK